MGEEIKTHSSVTGTRLRYAAAALAFAAELVHLWAFAHEFAVFPTRGLPLLPLAAIQGMLAVGLLFGAGRWTIGFGIFFNLAVALGWAFTRIVGVPSGGVLVRMPVGLLDLVATATEAALVAALVVMLADPKRNLSWAPGPRRGPGGPQGGTAGQVHVRGSRADAALEPGATQRGVPEARDKGCGPAGRRREDRGDSDTGKST